MLEVSPYEGIGEGRCIVSKKGIEDLDRVIQMENVTYGAHTVFLCLCVYMCMCMYV